MEQLSCLEIDGKQLEIADESARRIADSAKNTAETAKNTADSAIDAADTATAIAKGRNQAHVFNTTDSMKAWLSDANNKGIYNKGDNIYIVDVGVPDWWVSEVLQDADSETGYYYKIAQLETQKVDLTEINAEISQINSSLSGINVYVGDDKKLHFVDSEGADSVLPFSSCAFGTHTFSLDETYEIDTGLSSINYFCLHSDDINSISKQFVTYYDKSKYTDMYGAICDVGTCYSNKRNIGVKITNNYSILSINGGKITVKAPDYAFFTGWNDVSWFAQ